MMAGRIISFLIAISIAVSVCAQEQTDTVTVVDVMVPDSGTEEIIKAEYGTKPGEIVLPIVPLDSLRGRKSFLSRVFSSILDGNVDHTHERAVDLSFALYPSYSHEPGVGIGGAFTALYRINRADSVMVPSDAFLSFNASIKGFFQIYIKGNHLFPNRKSRINYVTELYRMPLLFWGINVEQTATNPKSKYDRYMADVQINFEHEILQNVFVGARLRSNYTAARSILNPEYLLGERTHFFVNGVGLILEYDTRDNLLNPSRGVHLLYRPTFYPEFMGSAKNSFMNHTFIANAYTRLWRGAILGGDVYCSFNSKKTPWTMREMVASDGIRMRGYYMGSYIDNSQVAVQAEYRQHVYRRLGFTLWGGFGALFNGLDNLTNTKLHPEWLPNYGVGLRFEMKKNANIRLDCGFGKGDFGVIFAFGEAF